jgi:oligopeptide/dipeptide ABC transporter ATP-binding protein
MAALVVTGLCVEVTGHHLLNGVDFTVTPGRLHALVGESGSGKTLTALAVLGLLPEAARVVGGSATLGDARLLGATPQELARLRGKRVTMVPQEPLGALSPVHTVGAHLLEVLELHRGLRGAEARRVAVELLTEVSVAEPEQRLASFAHQLSGGTRQRVLIAAALACGAEVVIADEPTTALDAPSQGVVLQLFRRLARTHQLGVWVITHDLGVVRDACDDVSVMYAGEIVERGAAEEVLASPLHPYTRALLGARPHGVSRGARLETVEGAVPAPSQLPSGCRFRPRCARASAECTARPALEAAAHAVACFHPGEQP